VLLISTTGQEHTFPTPAAGSPSSGGRGITTFTKVPA